MARGYVIIQAEGGTIAEVLLPKKKCAVISKDKVSVDRSIISKFENMGQSIEVNYKEDFNIENILSNLDKQNFENYKYSFKITMNI